MRANDKGGIRLERLEGGEFVRCFMQYALPTGIKRICHYGVLASSCKSKKAQHSAPGLADAAHQPAGALVGPGFDDTGGKDRCAAISAR